MIRVKVNDEIRELVAGTNLLQALEAWDINGDRIACAINGDFTPRSQYADTQLLDGDCIDLVQPIGGG